MTDVSQSILCADIVCHHGLLIEVRRRRLINAETFETTEAFAVSDKVPSVLVVKCPSAAQDFERVIGERPALTCPTFSEDLAALGHRPSTSFLNLAGVGVRAAITVG